MIHERRERLLRDALHAAAEVVTFEDLSRKVLPIVERLFDTSSSLLYRSDATCPIIPLSGGDLAAMAPRYVEDYLGDDPLQTTVRRTNPWIFSSNRLPDWEQYLGRPVHRYLLEAGISYLFHIRLMEGAHYSPGMVGCLLARGPQQAPFSAEDEAVAAQLHPSLAAATRRSKRALTAREAEQTLDGLLDACGRPPTLTVDLTGRLLWVSSRAESLLGGLLRGRLPVPLCSATQRMARHRRDESSPPRRTVDLRARDGSHLVATLRLCRPPSGAPFIAIELEQPGVDPEVDRTAERYGLTPAETRVLGAIARGCSDSDIAAATGTAMPTVRTHVTRILSKLDVRSRLQAALVARDVRLEE